MCVLRRTSTRRVEGEGHWNPVRRPGVVRRRLARKLEAAGIRDLREYGIAGLKEPGGYVGSKLGV